MERDGYALDTGPSVFTAPEILADTLAAVGEKLEDRLTLLPLETTYRAQFADGSHLDVHADPDAFAAEVAALCGPAEADALRRYLADLAELYRLQLATFIDRNLDSPLDLLGPELVALARRGGFGRLSRHVGAVLRRRPAAPAVQLPGALRGRLAVPGDRRLRRHRPARHRRRRLAPGRAASPRCPARWPPPRPTPGSRSATARDVAELETSRTPGRRRPAGRRRAAAGRRRRRHRRPAAGRWCPACAARAGRSTRPSCVALHLGVRAELPGQAHHTISFGQLVARRVRRAHPRRAAHDRPEPAGQHAVAHRPQPRPRRRRRCSASSRRRRTSTGAAAATPTSTGRRLGPRYRDELLATLEARGWTGLTGAIEVEEMATPRDWAAQGMAAGTPFALAHTFGQTGPFRPSTLPRRGPENVVLAGSSVQPGVGVPMVLISGRLAAERITG